MKPQKTIYPNQEEIHELIINKIKKDLLKETNEAYLIGSLAEGKFGFYDERYEGYFGSDIDLVVISEKINPSWKYEGEFYGWHKKYFGGEIKIKKISHPISLMVPFNTDISLFWQKAKELNWKVEKLK
jgi:predicted nucleotidyltransferase